MKVDVVIPTKDRRLIQKQLLKAIGGESEFGKLIITEEKPLSTARKAACLNASTEWVAMFDDDVLIPPGWLAKVNEHVNDDIGAVSTVAMQSDADLRAYAMVVSKIYPLRKVVSSPYINNILIRKELLEDYDPPKVFLAEDQFLRRHVDSRGYKWKTIDHIGVIHTGKSKNKVAIGMAYRYHRVYNLDQLIRRFFARMFFSPFAVLITRKPSTFLRLLQDNVCFFAGWLKG